MGIAILMSIVPNQEQLNFLVHEYLKSWQEGQEKTGEEKLCVKQIALSILQLKYLATWPWKLWITEEEVYS